MSETCRGHLWDKIIIKLFASSWYIFLTYIYDARSHLHQTAISISEHVFNTKYRCLCVPVNGSWLLDFVYIIFMTSSFNIHKIFTAFCYVNFHTSDKPRNPTSCSDLHNYCCLFVFDATAPQGARASSFTRFLDHTQWRTTVDRIPLDEWSARRRDLYLTTHNTHNRQTSMTWVGFEPTISAGERP